MELLNLFGLTFPKWCMGRDFNIIRKILEKLGVSKLAPSTKDLDGFIKECELIDAPLRNASFTWSNRL